MSDEIKRLVIDAILKAVMSRLVTIVPFLGMPIIGPIVGFFVGKLLNMVGDELALMIQLGLINIEVNRERKKYDEAVDRLRVELEKPEGERDEKLIEEARREFKEKLRDLVTIKPD